MVVLKIKVWIYQFIGLYLAEKEELEYVTSKKFWKSFIKIYTAKGNDMSPETVQALLIGLWQLKHGFTRASRR